MAKESGERSKTREAHGRRVKALSAAVPVRLACCLAGAVAACVACLAIASPGGGGEARRTLSGTLAPGQASRQALDARAVVSRTVEQRNNIQLVENPGEIPYSDVWVLNDPFFPLIGEVGVLQDHSGTLDSKWAKMMGFPPIPEEGETTVTVAPETAPSSSLPRTASISGEALLVEDIYEARGIKYARIKAGDSSYDRLKAGSQFAERYKLVELKGSDTAVVMCGDERYELKKGQLRRI
jgi:hypothetical protein